LTVALGFLCTMMSVGVRPQVLELVYLSLALVLIDRLRQERLKPASFAACMTVLALLWVNTHGSFPLLAVVLVLTAAGELIERRSHWRILLVSAALATVGFLVNPWGYHIISFAIQSMQSAPTLSSIDEWKPPQLGSGSLIPFNVAALLALASVLPFVARRRWQRVDSSGREAPYAADVLVFLAVLYLGLQSGRHVMLFGIGASPLIADMIARSSSRFPPSEAADPDSRTKSFINLAALAFVAAGVILLSGKSVGRAAQDAAMARRYPVELLDEIRQVARKPGRMFNEYSWGGFLIGNGITPVFIDGRSELYGDEQLTRYARIVRLSAGWDTTLDSLQVQSAVLPVDSRLAAALRSQGWRMVAGDSVGVVLVR
jgi:hypothetical protein